ncbi:MAG: serine protease [Bryobacteraceae bacterium]
MSPWSDALEELKAEIAREQQQGPRPGSKAAWAKFLGKKVKVVADFTGRPLVVYATACTSSGKQVPMGGLQIDFSDKIGFSEVVHGLKGHSLDFLIHSPGGSPEAAESIIESLRSKFAHIRIIIPSYAKSAATMMAMAADEIIMDDDAELGPIDPQMVTANGFSPAEAIKEQFLKASNEIGADQKKLSVWLPILQQMGPSLLVQCDDAINLSKTLVKQWLTRFMFKGDSDAEAKADAVAEYLGQHSNFKSHGRCIRLRALLEKNFGLKISSLRSNREFHQKVWGLYCGIDAVFAASGIFKVFYNSNDQALVRAQTVPQIIIPSGMPLPPGVRPPNVR